MSFGGTPHWTEGETLERPHPHCLNEGENPGCTHTVWAEGETLGAPDCKGLLAGHFQPGAPDWALGAEAL